MHSWPAAVRMTLAEFMKLPEQLGLELIDGLAVKEPSPTFGHQSCVQYISTQLSTYVGANGLGVVIGAPFDVILESTHVLQPDVLFVRKERCAIITERGLTMAPDLAVEVLSPSTLQRDRGRKRELYFSHGCRELWLVNPMRPSVEAFWDVSDSSLIGSVGVLESRVVPGFRLDLARMFARTRLPRCGKARQ